MTRTAAAVALCVAMTSTACSDFATEPDRYPDALRLTPDTILLVEGDAAQFTVEVLDQNGEPFASTPSWAPALWSVSEAGRLELDDQGAAVALAPGESRVRVELSGMSAQSLVRTNPSQIDLTVPFAHVTQSSQTTDGDVPLIAGRDGLVRVYVTGSSVNFFEPRVRVRFFNGGAEVHSALLNPEGPSIPQVVDEGDLSLSYDAAIPGAVIQPGLSMVVEVDPDGRAPSTPGSDLRVPASGTRALDVRTVPPFRLRIVPVDLTANSRPSGITSATAAGFARFTEDVYPFAQFDVDVRAPFRTTARLTDENGWYQLIEEIYFLRQADGSDRYYYGAADVPPGSGIAGLGYVGYPTSIGLDDAPDVMAHELGHNLSLPHAPCGGPSGVDRDYPYAGGSIGQHGYERSRDRVHRPETRFDLMSYCDPVWISDYNYLRVLAYRDTSSFDVAPAPRAAEATLVVWGGVRDGALVLAPAVEWTTVPTRPSPEGEYLLEGLDAAGGSLFRVRVDPLRLDHLDASHFLVALPAAAARSDRLERLRLTGPEGRVEQRRRRGGAGEPAVRVRRRTGPVAPGGRLEGSWSPAEYPLAVARSRTTGEVVAMSRTGTLPIPDGVGSVDVVLSDGVRTHRARLVNR